MGSIVAFIKMAGVMICEEERSFLLGWVKEKLHATQLGSQDDLAATNDYQTCAFFLSLLVRM